MTEKKECSKVMDKFLELDKHERIPLWITKHILTCSECRSNVRLFTQAERLLARDEGENPFTYAAISDVKEKLYPGSTREKRVPILYWLVIGIILLFCMVFCAVLVNKFIPEMQGFSFIFIAFMISTYCMLFIGMNMDFFVKQSNTMK